jgi:GNAT superfamily N-acetyltransferase
MMLDEIIIRDATTDDMPFFFNSMLHHYKHSSPHTRLIADSVYYKDLHAIITRLTQRKGHVLKFVALKEDPTVVIAYIWANQYPECVHYIYVKRAFRKMGLAKLLYEAVFKDIPKVSYTFLTYDAGSITQKYKQLVYNPYLLDRNIWRSYQSLLDDDLEDLKRL